MPILDEEALAAACAYIDLNLVAAGECTSIKQRVGHAEAQGHVERRTDQCGAVVGPK